MVLVNKADGNLLASAIHTKADYAGAMQFIRRKNYDWSAPVLSISSKTCLGFDELEKHIQSFYTLMSESGGLKRKRLSQSSHWTMNQFKRLVIEDATKSIQSHGAVNLLLDDVVTGKLTSRQAAMTLYSSYKRDKDP